MGTDSDTRLDCGGWLPIASAPRDGSEIILAVAGYLPSGVKYFVHVGWWLEGDNFFPWRFIDAFDLTPTGCCDFESDDRVAANGAKEESVHFWQPLPPPPLPSIRPLVTRM